MKTRYSIAPLFLVCVLWAPTALAAEIFFGVNDPEVAVNEKFEVGVYAGAQGQPINAIEGDVNFPADMFSFEGILNGGSILPFLIKEPALSADGTVSFAGIVPGGYIGVKGYLFSVLLTAKQAGNATISVSNERMLINDGNGTAAELTKAPLSLKIAETGAAEPFVPLYDNTPPEEFIPKISKDGDIFNGKWFISFVAQDKGAGIDRYEIMETPQRWSFVSLFAKDKWTAAGSPSELKDQDLKSAVYVRAIDRAGNMRTAEIAPANKIAFHENYLFWLALIILFSLVGIAWSRSGYRRSKNAGKK